MKNEPVGSLLQRTLELLKTTDETIPQIYVDTQLPFYWLQSLREGRIKNPSVNRVQRLYEHLSGKKLEV